LDWDGDGKLEVVFTIAHAKGSDFVPLEIGVGDEQDVPLECRVLGFSEASPTPLAFGGTALTVSGNDVRRLPVNFNLRAEARPPQIVLVLPPDGATEVPVTLTAVTVVFSTVVDASTLSAVQLTGPQGAVAFDTKLDTVDISKGDPLQEQRSILTLRLKTALADGQYAIAVGPELKSAAGLGLDQDPSTPLAEGFSSSFEAHLLIGWPLDCMCKGRPEYTCNPDKTCTLNATCAPGCGGLGFVCDPAGPSCVSDCRVYGPLCPKPGTQCDASTGLCR